MPGTIHATVVAIGETGVLIEGPPGAGKSDLALRLIDRGATLVADDRTALERRGDALHASPPATIAGRIEVRGLGIVALPHRADVPLALAVALVDAAERMPEPATRDFLGVALPLLRLEPFAASAPIKVEIALSGTVLS